MAFPCADRPVACSSTRELQELEPGVQIKKLRGQPQMATPVYPPKTGIPPHTATIAAQRLAPRSPLTLLGKVGHGGPFLFRWSHVGSAVQP